ncbi:cadherin-like domain-containing protein [Actinocrinis puniceicyclus]|uniref:Cadherin-like domain-containing protein n=1 Tax=Actinocrinis puniceicyclus TaxID=977794 RepID=A0A8J8BE12_9ACTN|nr:Ig-like domain-containing protein [Actinocrinis puniceicyclus]MBS2964731.1 cadherin-like domain-containing protein [Actinocrinis puniceicyclus]
MKTSARIRRRWTSLASVAVLTATVGALIAGAVLAEGYPVQHVALHDGGIWVTNNQDGLFGRLNKPAGALDAAFYPPKGAQSNYQLDILQDGSAVAAWDQATGELYPVDTVDAKTLADQGVTLGVADQAQLSGGTLATLDPRSGAVRAAAVDGDQQINGLSSLADGAAPVASVATRGASDAGAALAVGVDGAVYAVAANGKTAAVARTATGFAAANYGSLGKALTSVRVTAVGDRLVALDAATGTLIVSGGPTAHLDLTGQSDALLQVPGPAAATVLVATSRDLLAVDLSSGQVSVLSTAGSGKPAAPVFFGNCAYAAWATTQDGLVAGCDGRRAGALNLADAGELVAPVFRQNRGALVLNDLATGVLFDLTQKPVRVDDWQAVQPPPVTAAGNRNKTDQNSLNQRNQPPKAADVTLGARPNRTTILHPLDYDSDPNGSVLSISRVSDLDKASVASLAIAPDGQSVALVLGSASGELHFKYTIDDGKGLTATANITVQVRTDAQNRSPQLRRGYQPTALTAPSGGRVSLPVLSDWRDFDGDPLALAGASAKAGTAVATGDGFLDYTAPATAGNQTITYQVSDGRSAPVNGTVTVAVQSASAAKTVAPIAQPDAARGEVGHPVTIHPLDNDLPGSDPSDPGVQLKLAAPIASPSGAQVTTDLDSGTVTVTASRPGTYMLDYTDEFGNAPFAKSVIRVDIAPAPSSPAPPVAMPDVAVLYGQQPATVDVLANDYDPSGALLVVQRAQVVLQPGDQESGQLQVGIVDGHWLRINALSASLDARPRIVHYTVTDGMTAPVTGEVSVTQLPPPGTDVPVPVDDTAVVRAGDSVSVPVLDNDIDPAGAPLSLVANVPGAPSPGQLQVTAQSAANQAIAGAAYVTGNVVRYVAPPASKVRTPLTVVVDYLVQNPSGEPATGHLTVTVNPLPSATNPDRRPQPQQVIARAVAGETITVPIPAGGVDPDGDSVALTGIGSAPRLGRIVSSNATSLTYLAFPTSAGTDTFTYQVTDDYGLSGTSQVGIAVVPPGAAQPPVAVDDTVTAAPGAHVAVDVLANDLVAAGDTATVAVPKSANPDLPSGITVASAQGPVNVVAPPNDGKPEVVTYDVSDGLGRPSSATITAHSQPGYDIPPVVPDTYATPDGKATTATLDVLAQAGDPDGTPGDLTLSKVFDASAKIVGGKLVVPVAANPHIYVFEVRDPQGATAVGYAHVVAAGAGAPYAKAGKSITVPVNGKTSIAVSDYVADPSGRPLRLTTTDQIWAAPSPGLSAANRGTGQLVLTASGGYAGPASVTFQVTDGTSLTDPHGVMAVITLPVQVGPDTPVLRCPSDPLTAVEGGAPLNIDVTSVCHVWTANASTAGSLHFSAQWLHPAAGLSLAGSGDHKLTVTAGSAATPNAVGTLTVGAVGFRGATSQLLVQVVAAPPPAVLPITVNGVKAGQSATVNLSSYVSSQLADPVISVVSVSQTSGMPASASASGATVRITPGTDSHGAQTFAVTVTDVADRSRADRQSTGQIALNVLGKPDAPGTPTIGRTVLSRAVQLSWPTPADNGAPIDSYRVSYSGGQQVCAASPCTISNLTNGRTYTFTVQAHNLVDWSAASPASAPAMPNTVPDAVTALVTSIPQDGTLHLAWAAPVDAGTPVLRYDVTWTGGGQANSSTTSLTATGLTNDQVYTFTVIAVNAQGPGPSATVQGQSAGAPPAPAAPSLAVTNSTNSTERSVDVSWTAVDPNGPGPTTYTVMRASSGGTKTVCSAVAALTCPDSGLANDGTVYTYTVTAANADVSLDAKTHTSPSSPGTQMEAAATPDPITNYTATPTGQNSQAVLKFDAPASHGKTSIVTCTYSGGQCGSWTFPTSGQTGVQETIGVLTNGQAQSVSLQDCNQSSGANFSGNPCDAQVSATVTAYGPIESPNVSASASGQVVNFTVSVNPNGKPATVTVQTSRQTQTFTTGTAPWSWSSSDNMGYSSTDTINLTVSDPGRATVTASGSATTPPPPPTVTVSRGALCGYTGEPLCDGKYTCNNSSCGYIHIQTANFSGNVTCSFNSSAGGFNGFTEVYGPNQSKDSGAYFGYQPGTVYVTCGGVQGSYVWP